MRAAPRTPAGARLRLGLALGLALFVPAAPSCTSPGPAGAPAPVGPSTPEPLEESVRPGLNERFLAPDVDVQHYVDVFEGESREIAIHRDGIVAALGLRPGMDVADVGAGTGLFLVPFVDAVGPDGLVYPVEISPGFVEHLRARARDEGLDRVRVVLCTERSSSLPPTSCDLVFLCDTYHHVEYPRSTLRSLHQALRPGGSLVIVDFERIPGVSEEWILGHVRAGKETVIEEVEAAGFRFADELEVEGLVDNYAIRFVRD